MLVQQKSDGTVVAVAFGGNDYGEDVLPTTIELTAMPEPVVQWAELISNEEEVGKKSYTLFRGMGHGREIHFLYIQYVGVLREPMTPRATWAKVKEVSPGHYPPEKPMSKGRIVEESRRVWKGKWVPTEGENRYEVPSKSYYWKDGRWWEV